MPPGKTPKNLPTVILPHGGPDARDSLHFDWWAQFLANRGYAVRQPDYRGSSGYGAKFPDAGLHQGGLKMPDDITDGVKTLIAALRINARARAMQTAQCCAGPWFE